MKLKTNKMPISFDMDTRKTPMNQLIDFIEKMPETEYPMTTIMTKAMELVLEEKKQILEALNWGYLDFEKSSIDTIEDFYVARYGTDDILVAKGKQDVFIDKSVFPYVLICDCNSREHQIIIEHDSEDNFTYCHIFLVKHGFWRRLKSGLKYIFGYKCKYGQWDEFIFKPEHANFLRELSEFLSRRSGTK